MLNNSRAIHQWKKCIFAAWLCAAFILAPGNLSGQRITAKIVGTVTDPSGGAVPNALVSADNVRTGEVFKTSTNGAGNYETIVPVGSYTLSVEAPGFQKTQVAPFTLSVDQVGRVDLELKVGRITEQVQVQGTAVGLQTEDTSVSSVIGSRETEDLPLNGRTFVQLAWLSPGVNMATPGSKTVRISDGSLAQQTGMEANGARDTQNRFYFDGIQSMDLDACTFAFAPSIDAIQEFRIDSSTLSAEMGGAPGGQVNLITKSGTNRLHGTLWEFNRNNAFTSIGAFTPYSPTNKPPRLNRNQFGGNLGGPVFFPKVYNGKQKTFFFFNWESGRLIQGTHGENAYIPPMPYRTGDFSSSSVVIYDPTTGQPFLGNIIPQNRIASYASKFLTFVPPTNANQPGVNYIEPATTEPTVQNQYVARIDHRVGERDFMFGSYMYNKQVPYGMPLFIYDADTVSTQTQNVSFSETHSFSPSVVNEARIGWDRLNSYEFFGYTNNPALNIANIIGIAGVSTDPYRYGPPVFSYGYAGPTIGGGPENSGNNVSQVSDLVSIQKGKHAMRIGTEIERRNYLDTGTSYPRGSFGFDGRVTTLNGAPPQPENTFAAFLLGDATSGAMNPFASNVRLNYWWDSFFYQDNWKVSPHLTLIMGLRYDYFSPPLNRGPATNFVLNGAIPGIVPSAQVFHGAAIIGYPDTPGWPAALTYPDRRNWGPRIGFVWQPSRISDFVVRAGFGIYYTQEIVNTFGGLTIGAPLIAMFMKTTDYLHPFNPATAFATLAGATPSYESEDALVDPHIKSPYDEEWNFTIQKKLPRGIFMDIGYVGSTGVRLGDNFDSNRPIQVVVPGPGVASVDARRPLQGYSSLGLAKTIGLSTYNSLQMKVERRLPHGIMLLGAYTWSHSMSNCDATTIGGGHYLGGTQDYMNMAADKSPSGFDQRHHLSASAMYELPFFANSSSRPLRAVLRGWQLSTIVSEQTGVASLLGGVGDTTGTGISSRPDVVAGQAAMLARSARTKSEWFNTAAFTEDVPLGTWGNASRMPIYLPGLNNVDASAMKNWRFGESGNVQFRAEFFNLFNHVQWGTPGLSVTSPATFGIITTSNETQGMPGDKRIIQFGLKLLF